jgi:hypothetical protein
MYKKINRMVKCKAYSSHPRPSGQLAL